MPGVKIFILTREKTLGVGEFFERRLLWVSVGEFVEPLWVSEEGDRVVGWNWQ